MTNKKVYYNESKVAISIHDEFSDKEILLKNLSSGEKQIISIFAKIILDSSKNVIVLFDEPELSLSLQWQTKLLPDIIRTGKCDYLLAVTHSPFVFENELDNYASDMINFISYYH
ncbi:MAG: ATP-binding protein [Chitinophagaceae bacterium]|nr:ATP-binding protein [Chitinophagaceae bacterium]